jgi:hypothetical protein
MQNLERAALRGYMGIGSGSGVGGGISGSASGPIGGITSGSDPGCGSGSGLAGGSGRGIDGWSGCSLARKRCNVELHLMSNNEPLLKSPSNRLGNGLLAFALLEAQTRQGDVRLGLARN